MPKEVLIQTLNLVKKELITQPPEKGGKRMAARACVKSGNHL
ncbi:MAG: hypothetical protein M0021_15090 [Clostridia bacterium]|nr:hypothetical protein [Clostridia bacterium]